MTLLSKSFLLFAIILLLAVALRVWGLDRDSPSVDLVPDEATWTDEGTLALPALEAIRGDAPLIGSDNLAAGAHPFYNAMLDATFRVLGPGRVQGRALSILFGILGLVALARLGKIVWSRAGALLAMGLGATGFFSIVFDRLILTEGPLVALLSVLALAGVQAQSALGGLVVGIALGLVAVGVKLYALSLLPALAVLYALRRRRLLFPFLFGVGIILLAWQAFWVPHIPNYPGYVQSRLTEENMGLAEPLQIVLQVFLAGLPGYFFPYQIALLFLACLEGLALLLSPRRWFQQAPDLLLLALVWLPVALALPSFFRYMPTRYFLPAFPALVVLALAGLERLWNGEPLPRAGTKYRMAIGIGVGFFFLFQVAPPLPLFGDYARWIPVLGLFSPLLFYRLTTRTQPGWGWSKNTRIGIVTILLSFHLLMQGALYWFGIVQSRSDLAGVATNLSVALPPNAIVTGRMAGTLALLSNHRALSMYTQISPDFVANLSRQGPVWILILEGDEKLVTPQVQTDLVEQASFPVAFSHAVRSLTIWRFQPK